MDSQLEQARELFFAGIRDYEAGRFESAVRNFNASLSLAPGRPSTLTNLGAAQLKLGRFDEAIDVLDEVLRVEPANVDALGHRATALAEVGRPREALASVEQLLAMDGKRGAAWTLRGTLLREAGDSGGAVQSYRQAIANGADRELLEFYIAGVEGAASSHGPKTPPRVYVQSLFDGYADGFEAHLVEVLKYRAPQILVDGLKQFGQRFGNVLDLGCGTGLCGVLLRPLSDRLEGVDLSANMVRQSKQRGVYDEVFEGDIAEFLDNVTARYDLVVAADVFIYVGALEAAFTRIASAMKSGGVFCFSVEQEATEEVVLRGSLRYAHSAAYIEKLAALHGFDLAAIEEHAVREDQRVAIPGLFYWLEKR